jgi:hypothetical protein
MPAVDVVMDLATPKNLPKRIPGLEERYVKYLMSSNTRGFRDKCLVKLGPRKVLLDVRAVRLWLEEARGLPASMRVE